jgi:hypothetical protein
MDMLAIPRGDAPAKTMSRSDPPSDFPVLLRLGPGGGILRNEGGDEELAAVVTNARRLGRLAGQLMGMDPFVAMECTLASGRLLIYDEDNGETVALRVRNEASLQSLRERLGLS